jgi:hypothetical protein
MAKKMTATRKIAIVVGLFYLTANIAGPIAYSFELPILNAPNYLTKIAANETKILFAALLELSMAVAVAGIAIAVYPVLRKQSASIAIGFVAARIIEALIFVISILSLLSMLTLSHEFIAAGAPQDSFFHTAGELILALRDWSGHVILDVAIFPLAALMFYSVLYRSNLVPRWLSGWGLIGAVLYWVAGPLVMFELLTPLSTLHIALQAPLGLQEMALALWLIVKGFNVITSASVPETQLSTD